MSVTRKCDHVFDKQLSLLVLGALVPVLSGKICEGRIIDPTYHT